MKNYALKKIRIFIKHINKKKFKLTMFLSFLTILLYVMIFIMPATHSKYSSETQSKADTKIAFYLLKTDYLTDVVLLDEIAPRNEPYTYKFKITNNNGTKRTETDLQYDLSIRTTTNLPLTYDLYLNSEYTDNNATSIITSEQVVQDDDGTYFNIFKTDRKYFNHTYNETNEYQLVVYFPSIYIDELYQDIVDSIEITVDSKQIINE